VVLAVAGGGWRAPRRSRTVATPVSSRRSQARAPGHEKNSA
jgi:hypothetical protein